MLPMRTPRGRIVHPNAYPPERLALQADLEAANSALVQVCLYELPECELHELRSAQRLLVELIEVNR